MSPALALAFRPALLPPLLPLELMLEPLLPPLLPLALLLEPLLPFPLEELKEETLHLSCFC